MKRRTVKRKVVELDVIDVNSGQLQEVEIKGYYGVFTELRVDKSTLPKGINCYELRHGDDDSYPVTVEEKVSINYYGAVLMTDKMELGEDGYVELTFDDFGFTGEDLTMLEYRANYLLEPECFSCGADLMKFMKACDTPFELSEVEADKLLEYMNGHDFLLAEMEGKLFRGDLSYQTDKIRWSEDTIDDVIKTVFEWNDEMIRAAIVKVENAREFIDFSNKMDEVNSLKEDEQIFDALFDRTRYGKELDELAEKLASELIEDMLSEGGIDYAIQKMMEAIAEGEDLLPEVSPELKQRSGEVR